MITAVKTIVILLILLTTTMAVVYSEESVPFKNYFSQDIETLLENMSLEQKIGQILIFGFQGTSLDEDYVQWIKTGILGNIKIFLRNVDSKRQLAGLIESMVTFADNTKNGIPLFIATDLEGGVVNHIRFPGISRPPAAGLIGATTYAENNRTVSRLIAHTLIELGINMNFAPCADVLTKPNNVVIGTRSYSSDPILVSAMVKSFVEEQKEMGILATMKHFPGHGMTDFDSHHHLKTVHTTRRELEQIHLLPYSQLIQVGLLDGCMVSHIIYSEFDPEHPAAFSHKIVNEVLRKELAFDGIVVTDDLEMKGSQKYAKDIIGAFLLAFNAGDDLILISHTKSKQVELLNRIPDYFRNGTLSEDELDQKVLRILRLKNKYLPTYYSLKSLNGDNFSTRIDALKESQKAIREGIVLLSSRLNDSIPAYFRNLRKKGTKGLVLSPTPEFSYLAEKYLKGWDVEYIGYLPDRRSNRQKIEEIRHFLHAYDFTLIGLANIRQIEWAEVCVEEKVPFCILSIDNPFSAHRFEKDALFIAASFDPYRPGLDALFKSVFETGEFEGIFPYYF